MGSAAADVRLLCLHSGLAVVIRGQLSTTVALARAMVALPLITHCYDERVAVLRELVRQTLGLRQAPECTSELADCFVSEVVWLRASIAAMQAEVQQGL